jgi:predicted nucleic acid-binding protein
VVDSSVAVRSSLRGRFLVAGTWRLLAPPLLWSEVRSSLHEGHWRREIDSAAVAAARRAFGSLGIDRDDPPELDEVAWEIADELGLAKTYDAEFLALARIRGCLLVTADARLRRGADRLGFVVDPVELTAMS